MDRTQFIIATAVLLFGAFVLGFLTHWVITRLSRVSRHELDEFDTMADSLHEAEEARDAALTARHETELRAQRKLNETEAELRAAMDGLREARHEVSELQAFIADQNMRQS